VTDFDIRPVRDEELAEYFAIRTQAFGLPDDDEALWRRRATLDPDALTIGAFAGEMLGGLRVIPVGQFLLGRSVPTGAVAGVVVRPEARGHGVARALLLAGLEWMAARGLVAAALHPASTRVYRSVGFELAGRGGSGTVPTRSLAAITTDEELAVVRLGDADRERVHALWDEYARSVHGALDRTRPWWRFRELGLGPGDFAYGVQRAERLVGALHYTQRPAARWTYGIDVRDFAALDRDAAATLWRFLGGHSMQVPTIRVPHAAIGNLLLLLDEQDPVVDAVNRWMHRVVELPGFMAARGFRPGTAPPVRVEVRDPWPGGVRGVWELAATDGQGRAIPADDPEVTIDIGALSALAVGRFDVPALRHVGRIDGDDDALARLAGVLSAPRPTMTDDF
jgi:predicted acetyltransferase